MINYNDEMLFQNKINQKKIEKAHYIELEKYSKKMYKREIATNLIISVVIIGLIISVGAVALCGIF